MYLLLSSVILATITKKKFTLVYVKNNLGNIKPSLDWSYFFTYATKSRACKFFNEK